MPSYMRKKRLSALSQCRCVLGGLSSRQFDDDEGAFNTARGIAWGRNEDYETSSLLSSDNGEFIQEGDERLEMAMSTQTEDTESRYRNSDTISFGSFDDEEYEIYDGNNFFKQWANSTARSTAMTESTSASRSSLSSASSSASSKHGSLSISSQQTLKRRNTFRNGNGQQHKDDLHLQGQASAWQNFTDIKEEPGNDDDGSSVDFGEDDFDEDDFDEDDFDEDDFDEDAILFPCSVFPPPISPGETAKDENGEIKPHHSAPEYQDQHHEEKERKDGGSIDDNEKQNRKDKSRHRKPPRHEQDDHSNSVPLITTTRDAVSVASTVSPSPSMNWVEKNGNKHNISPLIIKEIQKALSTGDEDDDNVDTDSASSSRRKELLVKAWLLLAVPHLHEDDADMYTRRLVEEGFDSPAMLESELLEEDLGFMKKAHKRALMKSREILIVRSVQKTLSA